MSKGPTQRYLARYNGYRLPGYVQEESFDSMINIANHQSVYADASLSDNLGLNNKTINLRFKVWEQNYAAAKDEIQKAAVYLRSERGGFAPLYVQFSDRYYEAIVMGIQTPKEVGNSTRLRDYSATFEAKPWLIAASGNVLSGTDTVSTTGRTMADGGWTPTTITVTGSNVTISGYTDSGHYAGFVSIDGAVSDMIIDSEIQVSTIDGANANDKMLHADFGLYVGPGNTNFVITGASSCSIEYHNRWYI